MPTAITSEAATSPTLSIVVPTHGRVDLFEQTLASLEAQTFTAFEVIVTDDSAEWEERSAIQEAAAAFGNRTGRLTRYLFSAPSLGQARNTNQGLRAAQGRFVRILHSDDLLAPRALETEMTLLHDRRLNLDLVCHMAEAFSDAPKFDQDPVLQLIQPSLFFRTTMHSGTPLPSATVFRRELLDEVGCMREDFDFLCDWELVARLLATQHRRNHFIARLTPGFVGWRVHPNSTTGRLWHRHFLEHEQFMNELRDDEEFCEALIGDQGTRDGFFATAVRYRYDRLEQDILRMEATQRILNLPMIARCALSKSSLHDRRMPAPWEPEGAAKYPGLVVPCDVPTVAAPPSGQHKKPAPPESRWVFWSRQLAHAIIAAGKRYAAELPKPAPAVTVTETTAAAAPREPRTDLRVVAGTTASGEVETDLLAVVQENGVDDIALETSAVAPLLAQHPTPLRLVAANVAEAAVRSEEVALPGPAVLTAGDQIEIQHALQRPRQKTGVVRIFTEYNNSTNFWPLRELIGSATTITLCEINANAFTDFVIHQALKHVSVGTQVRTVLHDNQHLTSFGFKSVLERLYPEQFAWVGQHKEGPIDTAMSFERRKPSHRAYSAPHTGWTFGMLTTGTRLANVDAFIRSVEAFCDEPYEIVLVSPVDLGDLAERPHVRVIHFTEHDDLGWITRKKNLICKEATFSDILICHDRFTLDVDFTRDFRAGGFGYGLAALRVRLGDGRRGLDWAVVSSQNQVWSNGGLLDYRQYSQYAYNPGGATVIRKAFWRDFAWNENLFWNEHEDVELCRRIQRAGGIIALARGTVIAAEDRWVHANPRIPYCDQNEVLYGRAVGEQRIRFLSKESAA